MAGNRPMANVVFLVGNLGRPARRMNTQKGKPYAFFSVAITRDWYQGQEGPSPTDWIDCVTYNSREVDLVCDERCKGASIMVSGRLQVYEATRGDEKIRRTQVVCKTISVPTLDNNVPVEIQSRQPIEVPANADDDDIPF
jgi:single stranded DNA-binding protein